MVSSSCRRLGRLQHRRLARSDDVGRPAHGGGRVGEHHLAGHQPIEEAADGGQMLLDRGGAIPALHVFDVGGHRDRGNLCKREPVRVAPGEEPRHGRGVCRARVRVADLGGEKLDRPLGGLRSGAPDGGREAFDLPAPGQEERLSRLGHRCQGVRLPAGSGAGGGVGRVGSVPAGSVSGRGRFTA